MDDAEGVDGNARNQRQTQHSKLKYRDQLQQIANRKRDHVTIDLDDLQAVSSVEHSLVMTQP